ncbi:hypothetical protein RR46_05191 [Papilio xuthus]|uniref:Uncharacterized protein n=1 Tax=Papilio xuthus TaxID=66420 RepID=A0A194Q8Y3_PAPXU|nr:hypothetical protein RR46_05191 [Papilio xuthus]
MSRSARGPARSGSAAHRTASLRKRSSSDRSPLPIWATMCSEATVRKPLCKPLHGFAMLQTHPEA